MTASVTLGAPAKLNLYLHVLGRRADGYHEIESLAAFATPHDAVTVTPADGWTLTLEGEFHGALRAAVDDQSNMVLRAGRLLASHFGRRDGAAIRLRKMLPIAAGLGGGSADGAALLLALCRMWQVEMPLTELAKLALPLGADLPVCLASRSVFMAGIGERIDPAPAIPPLGIVLVNPGVPLATAAVFGRCNARPTSTPRVSYRANDAASLIDVLKTCRNDLTAPAMALAPVIGDVLAAIEAAPGLLLGRLSGSGPTCFGLFADEGGAQAAAARIVAGHASWWVRAGRLIGGREDIAVA